MKATDLKNKVKNLSFELGNYTIENCGLELELIVDLPFMKLWSVKNHKELSKINNTKKIYDNNLSNIGFSWK